MTMQSTSKEPTNFLEFPNELFYHIFIYLRSDDLLRIFVKLHNRRLITLVYAYIQHLDLCTISTTVFSIDDWLPFQSDRIVSLRITNNQLNDCLFFKLPMLNHLIINVTSLPSPSSYQIHTLSQIKSLFFSYDENKKPKKLSNFAQYLWHENSRVEHLSIMNCLLLKQSLFSPSPVLTPNRYLTRLSILLQKLSLAVELMPYVPALEHLDIRIYSNYLFQCYEWAFTNGYCKSQAWPLGVKSLRFVACNQLTVMPCLSEFIRRFSSTLEYLSFLINVKSSYLTASHRNFDYRLLRRLPRIRLVEFSINTGILQCDELDARHTFDNWKRQQHIISIFHTQFSRHTRFTYPYIFDSLEYVSNDLLNFHSNQYRSDFVLSFPSVVNISFYSNEKLSLVLFMFIQQACPHLRRINFDFLHGLTDDFLQDVQLTFPSIVDMYFGIWLIDFNQDTLLRLLRLVPYLKCLFISQEYIDIIICTKDYFRDFKSLDQITVTECSSQPIHSKNDLKEYFPNINIFYEMKK